LEKQLAEHCDSGFVIEGGAAATTVADSWLHDCRVGGIVWSAGEGTVLTGNAISAPRDHAIITDRNLALETNELGGDVWVRNAART
jgi:hypothetical protein